MLNRDRAIVTPFLDPGEHLLAAAPVTLAPGIPHPPAALLTARTPGELEQRLDRPLRLLRRAYGALNPVGAAVGAVEDRVIDAVPDAVWHGAGMAGGWPSEAGRFVARMHDEGAHGTGTLAVTDRRILVTVDRSRLWQLLGEEHTVHWQLPRPVVTVHRNPTGVLQRGRVDLHFADRSWVAVTTPLPAAADELARAAA